MFQRILWGAMALIFSYVLAYLLLGQHSAVGYFSPDTLEYGTQGEMHCSVTGISLARWPFQRHDNELVQFLVSKGYWQGRKVYSPRWIRLFHSSSAWRDGESLFHRHFFWRKDQWIEWTNKNPDAAAQFWPEFLELLRSGNDNQAMELLREIRGQLMMKCDSPGFSEPDASACRLIGELLSDDC